jgi:hypothetical protein
VVKLLLLFLAEFFGKQDRDARIGWGFQRVVSGFEQFAMTALPHYGSIITPPKVLEADAALSTRGTGLL